MAINTGVVGAHQQFPVAPTPSVICRKYQAPKSLYHDKRNQNKKKSEVLSSLSVLLPKSLTTEMLLLLSVKIMLHPTTQE